MAPVSGAVFGAASFLALGGSVLPAWTRNAGEIVCGALGLLAGGIVASGWPPATPARTSSVQRLSGFGFLGATAVLAIALLVAVPTSVIDSTPARIALATLVIAGISARLVVR